MINTFLQLSMTNFTLQQRFQIIQIYFENGSSIRATYRRLRDFYEARNRPSEQAIRRIVDRFRSTFSLHDAITPTRQRNARNEDNIAAVSKSVTADPNASIRRRSQETGLSQSTLWNILHKDLDMYPYKIQLVQELQPQDHGFRRSFVDWALENLAADPYFYRKIVFSDEAHFSLNGFVNKQNCRIWSETNPKAFFETSMYPEKCTVWCALHAGGIIGPYFFKNDVGARVTVNGDRYRTMLKQFLFKNMEHINPEEIWFQQDGATCHTAAVTIELLKSKFGQKLITKNGPVNWPARSCDLTPLDYFLWGYLKSQVYADKPATINALESNISRVILDIQPAVLENVAKEFVRRMQNVKKSRGGHMPEIIFKC